MRLTVCSVDFWCVGPRAFGLRVQGLQSSELTRTAQKMEKIGPTPIKEAIVLHRFRVRVGLTISGQFVTWSVGLGGIMGLQVLFSGFQS